MRYQVLLVVPMRYQVLKDTLKPFTDFYAIADIESNRRTPSWDYVNQSFSNAVVGYYPFLLSGDLLNRWIVIAEADTLEDLKLKVAFLFI